ncbi:adhesion G protein-coupled receptor L3-like [Clavelina lepadiformis]|uniref:adhesion G protein-coupled receptor L3-like n=1 Tax=Clavelina lepadiformis TaxID=159417 RepID=UPI0040423835
MKCILMFSCLCGVVFANTYEQDIADSGYDYNGYDNSVDDGIYDELRLTEGEDQTNTTTNNVSDELASEFRQEKYRKPLDHLFGSKEKSEDQLFHYLKVRRGDDGDNELDYWTLDFLRGNIVKQFAETGSTLSQEDQDVIKEILRMIEDAQQLLFRKPNYWTTDSFKLINSSKSIIECALGREGALHQFNSIERALSPASRYQCGYTLPFLWAELVGINYKKKSCSLKDAIEALDQIQQAAKIRKGYHKESNTKNDDKYHHIKVDLIMALSKPKHLEYLKPLLCNEVEQVEDCEDVATSICKDPTIIFVSEITSKIQKGTKNAIPKPSEITTMLEIQQELASVSNQLASSALTKDSKFAARQMLDSYMGIVDTVIGNSSTALWKQVPQSETQSEFQLVLLSNEEYVGSISDIFLAEDKPLDEIKKSAFSLQMQKVNPTGEIKNKVSFKFGDAEIWTEGLEDNFHNETDVNVYALYYNSWQEVLNDVSSSSDGRSVGSGKKSFVGKGGVVSLSTRSQRQKKSVSVTYRMKISESILSSNANDTGYICLSCGYLDVAKASWLTEGCRAIEVKESGLMCFCNHTTNFAAFMSPFPAEFNTTADQELWLNIMQYVGSSLSVLGLLASFTAFCIVRHSVKNDRLRAHMNLVVALFFVHVIQLASDQAVYNNTACEVTTVATHYFLLASFMFMFVEGIFLYRYVVQVFVHSKLENRCWMYLIGWGIPVVIVAISAGYGLPNDMYIQPRPAPSSCPAGEILYSQGIPALKYATCWLSTISGMTWAFIAPAIAVILFNLVILCKVVQVLVKLSERSKGMRPYQPTYTGHGYRSRSKVSIPMSSSKPLVSEVKANEVSTASNGEESGIYDPLHANVQTHSGSYSKPRTSSHTYNQHIVVDKSRDSTAPGPGDKDFLSDVKTAIRGAAVLLPILGIPWICGMLGYKSYVLKVLFVVLNSIQGFVIFLVYCVFNGEVRRALRRHFQLYKMKKYSGRGRTSSTSSLKLAFNRGLLRNWRRRSTAVSVLSTSNHL